MEKVDSDLMKSDLQSNTQQSDSLRQKTVKPENAEGLELAESKTESSKLLEADPPKIENQLRESQPNPPIAETDQALEKTEQDEATFSEQAKADSKPNLVADRDQEAMQIQDGEDHVAPSPAAVEDLVQEETTEQASAKDQRITTVAASNSEPMSVTIPNTREAESKENLIQEGGVLNQRSGDLDPNDDSAEPPAPVDEGELDEFEELDNRIRSQVKVDKQRQQKQAGQKMAQFCRQVGRCPICTLLPPCKHVNDDLVTGQNSLDGNVTPNQRQGSRLRNQFMASPDNIGQGSVSPSGYSQDDFLGESQFQRSTISNRGDNKPHIKEHRIKMNKILHGHASPYSILTTSTHEEFNAEKSYLEGLQGQRTTRAAAMRNLHLKKQYDNSIWNDQQSPRGSNRHARLHEDSLMQGSQDTAHSFISPRGLKTVRARDRRGMYQSIDISTRSPQEKAQNDLRHAENRLRTIEMISKFREEKIKQEFQKLEKDLALQEEKQKVERKRIENRKKELAEKMSRIAEYEKEKRERQESELQKEREAEARRAELRQKYMKRQQAKLQERSNSPREKAEAQLALKKPKTSRVGLNNRASLNARIAKPKGNLTNRTKADSPDKLNEPSISFQPESRTTQLRQSYNSKLSENDSLQLLDKHGKITNKKLRESYETAQNVYKTGRNDVMQVSLDSNNPGKHQLGNWMYHDKKYDNVKPKIDSGAVGQAQSNQIRHGKPSSIVLKGKRKKSPTAPQQTKRQGKKADLPRTSEADSQGIVNINVKQGQQ